MRIAFYNQMFALDGSSPVSHLSGHWAVHFQGKHERIWKRADVGRTLAVIGQSQADVVGIAEVLEGQEAALEEGLRGMGYAHVHFGPGHRTKYGKLLLQVALASKLPCERVPVEGFPLVDSTAGGGGIVECVLPRQATTVIVVHLSLPGIHKEMHGSQLAFLERHVAAREGRVVLMGDFNLPYKGMGGRFPQLELISDARATCSTTPLLRLIYAKDLDHILARGFSRTALGELQGPSDHKLLYADVEPKDG